MSTELDPEPVPAVYATPVEAMCNSAVQPAKDRRYCSMTIMLAHVVKSQDMVRASLDTEFRFTCYVDALEGDSPGASEWMKRDWGTRTFCVVDHAAVERWLQKAWEESMRPDVQCVVCLCPARTNTEYFHELVLKKAHQVRFIKGRLKMQGHTKQSPFPSCVVVFGTPPAAPAPSAPPTIFARTAVPDDAHV